MICLPRFRSARFPFAVLLSCLRARAGVASGNRPGHILDHRHQPGLRRRRQRRRDAQERLHRALQPRRLAVDVSGWSVQYASTAGTTWQDTNLAGLDRARAATTSSRRPRAPGDGGPPPARRHRHDRDERRGGQGGPRQQPDDDHDGTAVRPGPRSWTSSATGRRRTASKEPARPRPCPTRRPRLRDNSGCTETDNNALTSRRDPPARATPPLRRTSAVVRRLPPASERPARSSVDPGGVTLLTVTVTPGTNPPSAGITVTGDLTTIGGSATQTFYDDASHGDAVSGDNVFSFSATVAAATTAGNKTLPFTVADNFPRSSTGSISLTVNPPVIAIHDIQGSGVASPFAGSSWRRPAS